MPRTNRNASLGNSWGVAQRNLRDQQLTIVISEPSRQRARMQSNRLNNNRKPGQHVRYLPVRLSMMPT